MANENVVPTDAPALLSTLKRAGEALLIGQVMCGAIDALIESLIMDASQSRERALLDAMAACTEKMEAAIVPAQEEANELARVLSADVETCHD